MENLVLDTTLNYSAVEPPYAKPDSETQFEKVREYLGMMSTTPKQHVIYTTLPACNSDA